LLLLLKYKRSIIYILFFNFVYPPLIIYNINNALINKFLKERQSRYFLF